MALLWKSILSDMSIATSPFFPCPFAWKICFQPFTFTLCRSFVLRWVSCRQHMCGSCFLIHSAILHFLIGAFNPFTFKVIIDRFLFIADFFIPVFLSLSFPSFSYSSPFSISFREIITLLMYNCKRQKALRMGRCVYNRGISAVGEGLKQASVGKPEKQSEGC